ncbi:GAF domain-containing protein [Nephila pilipes]|uniref:GAF domain-containing protein n=1 Tax=Nephila pilipes TaxID=299642 RepID=A0A8X6U9K2_NEPPI|nr:GAF domain-containing protein [Nephila pilipes]
MCSKVYGVHLGVLDPRFNKDIDTRTGYRTVSVMCQPILNFQGDVIGVAQCINKVTGDHQFTEQDQEVSVDTYHKTFCLHNNLPTWST